MAFSARIMAKACQKGLADTRREFLLENTAQEFVVERQFSAPHPIVEWYVYHRPVPTVTEWEDHGIHGVAIEDGSQCRSP